MPRAKPSMKTMFWMAKFMGIQMPMIAAMPRATMMETMLKTSGSVAAASVPKMMIRMTRAMGTAYMRDFLRSLKATSCMSLLTLVEPTMRTRKPFSKESGPSPMPLPVRTVSRSSMMCLVASSPFSDMLDDEEGRPSIGGHQSGGLHVAGLCLLVSGDGGGQLLC